MNRFRLAACATSLVLLPVAAVCGPADVAGQKLDSGLGQLPHYRLWVDKTGRDPLGRQALQVATAR